LRDVWPPATIAGGMPTFRGAGGGRL